MRFKPYLLQQLGEGQSLKMHLIQEDKVQTQWNLTDLPARMLKSMNSFLKSVMTQRDPGGSLQELNLTTNSTSTGMELQTKSGESLNHRCLGIPKKKLEEAGTKTAKNPIEFSTSLLETIKSSSNGSKHLKLHPSFSLGPSGITSSKDRLLISTLCSPHYTTFRLLKRTLDMWDTLRSPSEDPNQQKRSKWVASGPTPGMPPSKWSNLLFLTENKNLGSMGNILKDISQPKSYQHIDE